MTMLRSRAAVLLALVALTACSGKSNPTTPPVTTASISVSAGSSAVTLAQGGTVDQAITITRTNFSGAVDLTAEGLPTGVTATFAPATLTAGATTSTVTLAGGTTATLGSASITIRARGTGVTDAVATLPVSVVAALPGSSVSLALSSATASLLPGEPASSDLTITRSTGYTGGVTLTVTGAPTGMTTGFSSSNPVTASTVKLSISTTTAVVPGTYTLTVRANAAGISEATTTYTVTLAPLPSNSVSFTYCNPSRVPVWFAYQNGTSSTWRRASETPTGTFTFNYDQPQVGVATVTIESGVAVTRVKWYGLSELPTVAAAECTDNPAPGTKALSGTATGQVGSNEVVSMAMGSAVSNAATQSSPAFTLTRVPDGARDLVGVLSNLSTNNTLRVYLQRALNPANNASLGTIDMYGANSFAPGTASLTVTAPNDGTILAQTVFTTANGSGATLTLPQVSSGVPLTYQAVPAAQLITSDVQQVRATQNVGASLTRFVAQYIRGPVAVSMTMPTDAASPTITAITGGAYPRATLTGTLASTFNSDISFVLEQASQGRQWELTATPAGRTGGTNYSLTIPDLSGVTGWQSAWGLASGTARVVSNFTGNANLGSDGKPQTGTTLLSIGRVSSFTFP